MQKIPRYNIYIITKKGKKIFAFTWCGHDIMRGMKRAESEAYQFGFSVAEVTCQKV